MIPRWRLTIILLALSLTVESETVRADKTLIFVTPKGPKKVSDKSHVKLQDAHSLPQVKLNPRRGTIVMRLVVKEPFGGGFGQHVAIYPGPPFVMLRCSAAWPKPKPGEAERDRHEKLLRAGVAMELGAFPDGAAAEKFDAYTPVKPGQDLHVAWTWSGIKHSLFLNGKLVTTHLAASPFPRVMQPALLLLHDLAAKDQEAAPVLEFAAYDFPFTEAEAARAFAEKDSQPLKAREPHGPSLLAQWAPGERKVHLTIDAGNALLGKARHLEATLQHEGKPLAREDFDVGADGFGERLVSLLEMPPGEYQAEVALRDREGRELGKVRSDPWELPETRWLGNRLGVTDKIQPPWKPIGRNDLTLTVWGRDYELAGGFGLPQQIVSQGRKLLASPVALELVRGGRARPLTNVSVEITRHEPHASTWAGRADAGDIRVRVDGRLEYDGMTLLKLTLEPSMPGKTVKLDGLKLHTILPKERALFLNTATDQGYWWHPYKSWLPDQRGGPLSGPVPGLGKESALAPPTVLFDNTRQKAAKTSFLFFVLLCDHDVGLEWFADGLGGWQVDERKVLQEIVREANGDVRLTCHLANRPFEIAGPITLAFGYDATPVKPLPADWRSAYVNHHLLANVKSDLALWWLWEGPYSKFRKDMFALRPDDLGGFAKALGRLPGLKYAPFTNQHVLVPSGPDRQRPEGGWPWFNNLLRAETDHSGWTAVPTRGARDYWAWNIDQWIKGKGMDAIYIDEANTMTVSARLLSGSGYLRPDGTHGFGHNTLAMREQIKRVRQVLIDNGKRPVVWIPVYGMIIPHAHAFVDVVSEGEAFMFEKPGTPDWIDLWGEGLLERRGGPEAKGGPWLLALGPAQKFGFVPVFLNYIKYFSDPRYMSAVRGQYGLLGLLDIIPVEPMGGWFFKAKQDFGVASPKTTFHRFFEQRGIRTDRADVPVSYYARGNDLLLIVTNLGKEAYSGPVKLDRKALGLPQGKLAASTIDGQKSGEYSTALQIAPLPFDADGTTLRVRIASHDFAMIKVTGKGQLQSYK
jgi:hypothetical protein